jgi:aspartate carbamoyltransferase catalytic subunit
MKRLGGSVDTFNVEGSAMGKGEDKESTLKNMDGYCDLFAIRDEKPYSVRDHAEYLKKPVINAGDGNNEHPTQFVVDAFTMDKELPGGVEGIRLAYVGDLLNGRTVHSSIKGFRMFDVKFLGVAPKGYGLQKELRRSDYQEADMENIFEALSDFKPDVIYWTRVQKNLGSGTDAEYRMKPEDEEKLPKGAIWLHPQPIVGELPKKWERDARALWFRQAHYGVPVRMALIAGILGHADDIEWALK